MPLRAIHLIFFALILICGPAFARTTDAALCDQAAERAALAEGVPIEILRALTRTETGRAGPGGGLEPWPWAVNQGGEGYWFPNAAEAAAFVTSQIGLGVSNLDIGCFQLNHHWHSAAFPSLDSMFDPDRNAQYAAAYLAQKYQITGDWLLAAGAYHSGSEGPATRYMARFDEILSGLAPFQIARLDHAPQTGSAPRQNSFPLLMAGEGAALRGSIVPQFAGRAALFAAVP